MQRVIESLRLMLRAAKQSAFNLLQMLPAKPYLYIFFYIKTGRRLSLKNPQRFTDKLQWLKLHGHLERFTKYGDKYEVRDYVAGKIGEQYLIPLIGVWETVEAIPFDTLPQSYVLKLTTGSGFNFICKDKTTVDLAAGKQLLERGLHEDFYRLEREPQYRQHVPRIIGEAYMEDETGQLRDFKIHCSKGEPVFVQVDTDRFTDHRSETYSTTWEKIESLTPDTFGGADKPTAKPKQLKQLLAIARKLSADFPYVRVDLYLVDGRVYFGELTFTPGSGIVHLPDAGDLELGKLIDLAAY